MATASPGVKESTAEYYRDTPTGPQTLCMASQITEAAAIYSCDLRGTPFETVAFADPLFLHFSAWLLSGGWDATVTTGTCPT